jgi:nucleoside-diphosphate-sugar epimerase
MTTRVLLAGAGGTLGRPLVEALVAGGYEVVGLTRTPAKRPALRALGAEAVVADALDEDALRAAMRRAAPEVVVHLLSALPAGGPTKASDLEPTNRLRRTGTARLLAAAVEAGVRRLVAESMVLVHGFGDFGATPLTEAAAATGSTQAMARKLRRRQLPLPGGGPGTISPGSMSPTRSRRRWRRWSGPARRGLQRRR